MHLRHTFIKTFGNHINTTSTPWLLPHLINFSRTQLDRVDPPSQCWASHVNTILVQTLIAKILSTKASTNTLQLSRIVLSRKNLTSSQSSSNNVAKPSISKLEIPFRAHYRTKWRHFVFDLTFGRARADKMPICWFISVSSILLL